MSKSKVNTVLVCHFDIQSFIHYKILPTKLSTKPSGSGMFKAAYLLKLTKSLAA
jgi:hypothetical protein